MSAKQKSSDSGEENNAYIKPNTDPELERKVDEMLSLEPVESVPQTTSKKRQPQKETEQSAAESTESKKAINITYFDEDAAKKNDTQTVAESASVIPLAPPIVNPPEPEVAASAE